MIAFKSVSTFRRRLAALLKVRRNVYTGVSNELNREFADKPIDRIRQNNDMILIESDLVVIKLRLPDKRQRLSKKDGFRLIYLVSKVDDLVVFLDIYPKNGPLQQLDIDDAELKRLIAEFITEGEAGLLEDYAIG
ncbi:MAG: hypothetical protein LUC44_06410 [Prevotellaceae bacterium]|nr:hypothetical protein [Prevotellaceae bacterium]